MIRDYNYLAWLKSKGLQPRTISQYAQCLSNLKDNCGKFDQKDVDKFVGLYKGNVVRSFLRSYKSYLLRNPADLKISTGLQVKIRAIDVNSPRSKKRKTPTPISKEEVLVIYRGMPNKETQLLTLLSFFCGLRRAEVLGLKAGDFNLKYWMRNPTTMGILKVIGKGNKEGIIPVRANVMEKVYSYLKPNFKEGRLLFPEFKPRSWNYILGKVSKNVIGKHVKPHTLRHSVAMHLRGKGFAIDEIKEFLRHEDISTTQIYSRVTPAQMIEKFQDKF